MRVFVGVIVVIGVVALAIGAHSTVPGWYQEELEVVATAGHATDRRALVRTWRTDDFTRVERVDEQLPTMQAIVYVISRGSTHERYTVNTAKKTIEVGGPSSPAEFAPNQLQPPTVLDRKVEDLGEGGRILAYPTRLVRQRRIVRSITGAYGRLVNRTDTIVRVMWIATFAANPTLADSLRKPVRPLAGVDIPRGIVLRSEETRERMLRRTVTHLEVRRLERRPIRTSLFALPTGYERISSTELFRREGEQYELRLKALEKSDPAAASKLTARTDSILGIRPANVARPPQRNP